MCVCEWTPLIMNPHRKCPPKINNKKKNHEQKNDDVFLEMSRTLSSDKHKKRFFVICNNRPDQTYYPPHLERLLVTQNVFHGCETHRCHRHFHTSRTTHFTPSPQKNIQLTHHRFKKLLSSKPECLSSGVVSVTAQSFRGIDPFSPAAEFGCWGLWSFLRPERYNCFIAL